MYVIVGFFFAKTLQQNLTEKNSNTKSGKSRIKQTTQVEEDVHKGH